MFNKLFKNKKYIVKPYYLSWHRVKKGIAVDGEFPSNS